MCLFCFVLLFCFFVCLQRTEHALEYCVTRMPHVKTWFKDQLASVMMDTKGLGQNALVSGSIVCQIVKRHLIAHIASVKDQLLKELCYTICYLFKLLELKAHQFNSKNNGPCLLLNNIFKHWSCFLSSVAKDDRDGDGLKLSVDFSPSATKGDQFKKLIQVTGPEQLLDEFYVISGIIKVQISVTRRCWRSRLITLNEK